MLLTMQARLCYNFTMKKGINTLLYLDKPLWWRYAPPVRQQLALRKRCSTDLKPSVHGFWDHDNESLCAVFKHFSSWIIYCEDKDAPDFVDIVAALVLYVIR